MYTNITERLFKFSFKNIYNKISMNALLNHNVTKSKAAVPKHRTLD